MMKVIMKVHEPELSYSVSKPLPERPPVVEFDVRISTDCGAFKPIEKLLASLP
jgi:hypothetical protein